ncbi:MAG: hypothetical protein ACOX9B_12555 [Candidatus Xenobium sp.]|jgi:hypothetical protein|nr:hypothetical protein [Burkholderiales bacterium]
MIMATSNGKPQIRLEGRRPAWVPGTRPRGDAPLTCLGIIILVLVGAVWGYYHFLHNRALENAGKEIVVNNTTTDEARNNYLRRMRVNHIPAVRRMGEETRKFSVQVFNGKVKDSETAEELIRPIETRLREVIDEVNSQVSPKQFAEVHRKLAIAVGEYWQTLVKIRKGLRAKETSEQKAFFKEAKGHLKTADANFSTTDRAIQAAIKR